MLLDTGAALTIISERKYNESLRGLPLEPSTLRLRSYTGDAIPVLGEAQVPVTYEDQTLTLPLVVVHGDRPALLGRNWLRHIRINWSNIFSLTEPAARNGLDSLLAKHKMLFSDQLGTVKGIKVAIHVKPECAPIFFKPRPLPYALREVVEKELEALEKRGTITKVDRSSWAAPIVVVPKKDKSVRLCGDYKVTVNRCIQPETYPLPSAEDLFATLAGGKYFSKIDLTSAYQQLELEPNSKVYTTITTHKGLYRYNRLPFGISTAPSIFQRSMDQILQGLEHVVCYLDDILVTSSTLEDHLQLLDRVLARLTANGIRANLRKCEFLKSSMEYLGYRIDAQGLHPTESKVQAIQNAPSPSNVMELRSFLGLLNYYGRFLTGLSTILKPLHQLLEKDSRWKWTSECEKAFKEAKESLLRSKWLTHYDPSKPLCLACDASPSGVGAVISHIMPNGDEVPIACASRTLSPSERNYAQIEREALGIVFGVKKFHKYLYGRKFTLITDHKPLTAIFNTQTAIPSLAALRMQRWALTLLSYNYDIVYRKSKEHGNADALSRLPLDLASSDPDEDTSVLQVSNVELLPVTSHQIAVETRRDPTLSKVLNFTLNGWPTSLQDKNLRTYFEKREQLSTDQGCLLWGSRVVVPPNLRKRLLHELHENHPGVSRMKAKARNYLWWPILDQDIEDFIKQCYACASMQNQPAAAPLHPWSWARNPWERIHIDYAELDKQHYLVVMDSFSKWIEVLPTKTTTAARTIELLRNLFASYGVPSEVVSDNGPQFISADFGNFLRMNGVKHIRTPPYHPASNGAAERAVQTFKRAWKKDAAAGNTLTETEHQRLARFLLNYRSTPHTITERTPAELFLKRPLRTRLDLVKPSVERTVTKHQRQQQLAHDKSRRSLRYFDVGDKVLVRDVRGNQPPWSPGVIVSRRGPLLYLVEVRERTVSVHLDHLLRLDAQLPSSETTCPPPWMLLGPAATPRVSTDSAGDLQSSSGRAPPTVVQPGPAGDAATPPTEHSNRYPQRIRRPPDRLGVPPSLPDAGAPAGT